MTFEELLEQIAHDYQNPSEGEYTADRNGHTRLADLQAMYKLSSLKVQKLLVTAGVYEPVKANSSYYTVKRLHEQGMSVATIMEETSLSKAAVNAFLPYERGAKNLDDLGVEITGDATRKRKQRRNAEMKKENARGVLAETLSDIALWDALDKHCQEQFLTASGQRFSIATVDSSDAVLGNSQFSIRKLPQQESIYIPQQSVFDAYHKAIEEKAGVIKAGADEKVVERVSLGAYEEFLRPVFIYLGVLDGNRNEVTTKRNVKGLEKCACCGRIGAPLYQVSSFEDLIALDNDFRKAEGAAWPEEQRRKAEFLEKMLESERKRYEQQVEQAKTSKAVLAFNEEGQRQFCQLCAQTIYHALEEGDAPYVGTKVNCRDLPIEMVKQFFEDQLVSTRNRWRDKEGKVFQKEAIYKAMDTEGTEHFFVFSYHRMDSMLAFDAQEVHRLTKAGRRAANNTDTDYEFHHLIYLAEGDDEEQRIYVGLIELMDEIIAGLKNPSLERGHLATTGTIIPVYIKDDEYGFLIDGKVYSGGEFAHMASAVEGWQIQFQVKDPTEAVLRANEYLMPVRLGKKELVDDTLELLRLFTADGKFISEHDEENFNYLFGDVLKKLKLYTDSKPHGFGKLAGMAIIKALEWYEGTEWGQERVREIIR